MNVPPKKPFGTTEARTAPLTKKDDYLIPGPGAYEESAIASKPSFSFPVASKRFPLLSEVIKVKVSLTMKLQTHLLMPKITKQPKAKT